MTAASRSINENRYQKSEEIPTQVLVGCGYVTHCSLCGVDVGFWAGSRL